MSTMEELARLVDRLTVDHLRIVARSLLMSPPPGTSVGDADLATYSLATEVLRFFFGNAWTNENVFPQQKNVSPQYRTGREFLKTESTNEDDQFVHMQRVTALAEIAFNLQDVEGIRQRVALMQNHDLEAALGELECATLLSAQEFRFRFVVPTGVKTRDYEGEVITSANRVVCCEIKSRSERTEPNPDALRHTLDGARKQLPKGKPGMILVKIPQAWAKRREMQAVVEAAVQRVCRQSHRIVAVVYAWEEWHSTPEGWRVILTKFNDYRNQRSELYAEDIDALLESMGRACNPHWLQFRGFVERLAQGL